MISYLNVSIPTFMSTLSYSIRDIESKISLFSVFSKNSQNIQITNAYRSCFLSLPCLIVDRITVLHIIDKHIERDLVIFNALGF